MITSQKTSNSSSSGQNEQAATEASSSFQDLRRSSLPSLCACACVFCVLWVSTFIHLIFHTINISSITFISSFIGHTCHQNWTSPNRTGRKCVLSSTAAGTYCGSALCCTVNQLRLHPHRTLVHLMSVSLMKLAFSHYVTWMYCRPSLLNFNQPLIIFSLFRSVLLTVEINSRNFCYSVLTFKSPNTISMLKMWRHLV